MRRSRSAHECLEHGFSHHDQKDQREVDDRCEEDDAGIAAGTIDDALDPDDSVFPPPLRLPLTGLPFGPPAFLDWFRFIGVDDLPNSGFPEVPLCVESICKLYDVNQRSFKVPCFRYPELGATGLVSNGVPIPPSQNVFQWPFFAAGDGFGTDGSLAYFNVEFPGDQPLP
jgi:hypothetical protein